MARNSINISDQPNQIVLVDQNRKVVVTDNVCNKTVTIELPQTNLIVQEEYTKVVTVNEGATGKPGTSGTSGTSGSSGTSGASGTDGTSGSSGTSGVDGANVINPGNNRVITSTGVPSGLLAEEHMLFTGTLLSISSSVEITGSTDSNIFLIKLENGNGQDEKLKVNNEGVLILGNMDATPTAVTGGLYYSNGSFYMGIG